MLFNSFEFLVLLLVTFAVYYLPGIRKVQVWVLIASSLVFYAYSNWQLLLLFITSVAINVTASYGVVHGEQSRRKLYATLGVIFNTLVLIFFKYGKLLAVTFFPEDNGIGQFLVQLPLPLGISFYTFEGISLVVDAYKGRDIEKYRALVPKMLTSHVRNTTFFVAFFPHLISGPILKAHDFIPQIKEKLFTNIAWGAVFRAVVVGYFLKMVIADNIKEHTFWIEYPYFESQSATVLWAMLLGYSMQIFADFAGYSLIAIGLGHLFGYRLPDNFNYPYISKSFKEFWKRWHISLSSFLMEYLYFPMGGNRKGKFRTYFNLMMVMFLGGLWHGAAWSYAIWGLTHGLALALERFLGEYIKLPENGIVGVLRMIGVFFVVTLAWLLFKLTKIEHAFSYFYHMYANMSFSTSSLGWLTVMCIVLYSIPVLMYYWWYLIREGAFARALRRYDYVGYGIMVFLILTSSGPSGDFIYFQF